MSFLRSPHIYLRTHTSPAQAGTHALSPVGCVGFAGADSRVGQGPLGEQAMLPGEGASGCCVGRARSCSKLAWMAATAAGKPRAPTRVNLPGGRGHAAIQGVGWLTGRGRLGFGVQTVQAVGTPIPTAHQNPPGRPYNAQRGARCGQCSNLQ